MGQAGEECFLKGGRVIIQSAINNYSWVTCDGICSEPFHTLLRQPMSNSLCAVIFSPVNMYWLERNGPICGTIYAEISAGEMPR